MNIFVDAFVDTNFGDNFFIHTIVTRYPKHSFFMIERVGQEYSYQLLKKNEKNIHLIDPAEEDESLKKMDAMMIVGGDMFWDYGDYSGFLKRMHKIKENGGWIAILGISLFERYSEKTKEDFKEMFSLADIIVVRDKETFLQVKKFVSEANVVISSDMAFTFDPYKINKKVETERGTLGISIRKKIPRNSEDKYEQYCSQIANVATAYLDKAEINKVTFLALSSGSFDDEKVAEQIIGLCPEKYRSRMKCAVFRGDIEAYITEMQKCEKMICTRFHSLVFALILEKPFVPIIYEEKMRRLLNEIAYYGIQLSYEQMLEPEMIISSLEKKKYLDMELAWYSNKGKNFFGQIDQWIKNDEKQKGIIYKIIKLLGLQKRESKRSIMI